MTELEAFKNQAEALGLHPEFVEKLVKFSTMPQIGTMLKDMQSHQRRRNSYLEMTAESLSTLPDEELLDAVLTRIMETDKPNHIQQLFQIAADYETEMQNGGLCKYLVYSDADDVCLLAEALEVIGSKEHANLFNCFLLDNGIDVNELSPFKLDFAEDWTASYAALKEQYPFDTYDFAFGQLPELREQLIDYARLYIEQF